MDILNGHGSDQNSSAITRIDNAASHLFDEFWQMVHGTTKSEAPKAADAYTNILEQAAAQAYDPQMSRTLLSLEHKYDSRIHNNTEAIEYAAQALKFAGDPFTAVELDPAQFPNQIGGIGALVRFAPDQDIAHGPNNQPVKKTDLQIVDTVDANSPAAKAGIQAGDKIESIDGVSMVGRTPLEVQELLMGAQGTTVDLSVKHGSTDEHFHLTRTKPAPTALDALTEPNKSGRLGIQFGFLSPDHKSLLPQASDGSLKANTNAAAMTPQINDVIIADVAVGSTADKAGLKRGDIIRAVNGHNVGGKNLPEISNALVGDVGAPVDLTILRNGKESNIHFVHGAPNTSVVGDKNLANGITYLKLSNFEDVKGADELRSALERHPDARAFVLDLRGNPGGLVQQSLNTAQLFLQRGTIVKMQERFTSPSAKPEYDTAVISVDANNVIATDTAGSRTATDKVQRSEPYLLNGRPLVILTNGTTASAAEMLTGALHDDKVATTLGEKTYGKGIGQIEQPSDDNSYKLKVTDMHYYTPSGFWPGDAFKNRVGLSPDVAVPDDLSQGDPQLDAAVNLINSKLKSH